jgi:hypothetical protein
MRAKGRITPDGLLFVTVRRRHENVRKAGPTALCPESGWVLVDGIDLNVVDPAWMRRQIGLLAQENVLFNRARCAITLRLPTWRCRTSESSS